jgi:hypothetical protein
MLNEMRFGKLSAKSISRWRSLSREVMYDDGISATELFVPGFPSFLYNVFIISLLLQLSPARRS